MFTRLYQAPPHWTAPPLPVKLQLALTPPNQEAGREENASPKAQEGRTKKSRNAEMQRPKTAEFLG